MIQAHAGVELTPLYIDAAEQRTELLQQAQALTKVLLSSQARTC